MTQYVVGFLFTNDLKEVLLIRKNRPDWQKGKLNGIGGKVEPGESHHRAMVREFKEETGMDVPQWNAFVYYVTKDYEMTVFFAKQNDDASHWKFTSVTDEVVKVESVPRVMQYPDWVNCVPNLPWLFGMVKSFDNNEKCKYFKIEELS